MTIRHHPILHVSCQGTQGITPLLIDAILGAMGQHWTLFLCGELCKHQCAARKSDDLILSTEQRKVTMLKSLISVAKEQHERAVMAHRAETEL
jgi:hypothetical protein